jgi:hypothetical protein
MTDLVAELRPKNFTNDFDEEDEVLQIHVRRNTFLVDDALKGGRKEKVCPWKKTQD